MNLQIPMAASMLRILWIAALVGFSVQATGQALTAKERKQLRVELLKGINSTRSLADMNELSANRQLRIAAQAHAEYLARHDRVEHRQDNTFQLFFGIWPEDRAAAAGYPSRHIRELAGAVPGDISPVTAFTTSVYHRLQILNPSVNEAGIGIMDMDDDRVVYVIVMGHSRWRKLCRNSEASESADTLLGQCSDDTRPVPVGQAKSLNESILRSQPAIVIWPPDNSGGVPPQLSDEQPRPLPGKKLLGNAVTIQFNITQDLPEIEAWQLLEERNDKMRDVAVEFMSSKNDPHALLRLGEYALVPLAPLQYGTRYQTRLRYRIRGRSYTSEWHFNTAPLPWQLLPLGGGKKVWIEQDKNYALKTADKHLNPKLNNLSLRSADEVRIEVEQVMQSILLAKFQGEACARAKLKYRSLPATELQIRPPGNLAENRLAEACRQRLEDSLPGTKVYGNGDVVQLASGKSHLISLVPESDTDSIGKLRWSAPSSCRVRTSLKTRLTGTIRIDCPAGRKVRFSLSKERFFQVVVR